MPAARSLYRQLIRARVRAQLQYRASFLLQVAGNFLVFFVDFAAIIILFTHVPAIRGWSLGEVAFLYGTSGLSFAIAQVLVGHVDQLDQMVRMGTFDVLLTRPRDSLFQLLTSDFSLRRVGQVLQSLVVLGFALLAAPISWSPAKLAAFVAMLVDGVVIYASLWILVASTSFWIVNSTKVMTTFTFGAASVTSWPLDLYGAWLKGFLVLVIPLAFVNYLPSRYILDKPFSSLPTVLPAVVGPAVAALTALVARLVWTRGVGRYSGAGG